MWLAASPNRLLFSAYGVLPEAKEGKAKEGTFFLLLLLLSTLPTTLLH